MALYMNSNGKDIHLDNFKRAFKIYCPDLDDKFEYIY